VVVVVVVVTPSFSTKLLSGRPANGLYAGSYPMCELENGFSPPFLSRYMVKAYTS
jgi:hypothetical protein